MTREEFLVYIDDYNAGDTSRLAGHYAPDIVFENYGGHRRGPEVLEFLAYLNTVVKGTLQPRRIFVEDGQIALEADMIVTALVDLPDLPIGSLVRGERKVSRTFAFYDTQGAVIHHIRLAGWPPV